MVVLWGTTASALQANRQNKERGSPAKKTLAV